MTARRRIVPGFRMSAPLVPEGDRPLDVESALPEKRPEEEPGDVVDHRDRDHLDRAERDGVGIEHDLRRGTVRVEARDLVLHVPYDVEPVLRARVDLARPEPVLEAVGERQRRRGARAVARRARDDVRDHPRAAELDRPEHHEDEERDHDPRLRERLAALVPARTPRRPRHRGSRPAARSATAASVPRPSGTLYGSAIARGSAPDTRSGTTERVSVAAAIIVPRRATVSSRRPRRAACAATTMPPSIIPSAIPQSASRGPRSAPTALMSFTSPPPIPPRTNGATSTAPATTRPAALAARPSAPKHSVLR